MLSAFLSAPPPQPPPNMVSEDTRLLPPEATVVLVQPQLEAERAQPGVSETPGIVSSFVSLFSRATPADNAPLAAAATATMIPIPVAVAVVEAESPPSGEGVVVDSFPLFTAADRASPSRCLLKTLM